jgi:hypothetical protein
MVLIRMLMQIQEKFWSARRLQGSVHPTPLQALPPPQLVAQRLPLLPQLPTWFG